jgi:hypothetical protein
MKNIVLAAVLGLFASTAAAFASVTIYSDGSTYDSATGITTPAPEKYAMGGVPTATDAQVWNHKDRPKVVRWGPPGGGMGGA